MDHENYLFHHYYDSDLLQIEALNMRIQLLKKGDISRKRRIKFIERLRSIKEDLQRSTTDLYEDDLERLEKLLVLLGVAAPPSVKKYYDLEKDRSSSEKIKFSLFDENEKEDLTDYTTPEDYQPVNMINRRKLNETNPPQDNIYIPLHAQDPLKEPESFLWYGHEIKTPEGMAPIPNWAHSANSIYVGEIVQPAWETPFGLPVYQLLEQHEEGAVLLADLKELCQKAGENFQKQDQPFDQAVITLLNRPYILDHAKEPDGLVTLLIASPEIHSKAEELLQKLDDLASTFRYRSLNENQKSSIKRVAAPVGFYFRSKRLTQEGMRKTVDSFGGFGGGFKKNYVKPL